MSIEQLHDFRKVIMQLSIAQLVAINTGIHAVAKTQMPAKVSFRLARFSSLIQKDLEAADKQRSILIQKYGHKDESGNIQVKPENAAAFSSDYTSILEEKVDVLFTPIPISDMESVSISPADIAALEPILTE